MLYKIQSSDCKTTLQPNRKICSSNNNVQSSSIQLLFGNKLKLNPKTFGWVRPDGIIVFATKDAAKNYAINRCKEANNLPKRLERAVVVKDNMILLEVEGKFESVHCNFNKLNGYKDCDFYHNHPLPGTLSINDFAVLKRKKCLKSMTAIDMLGRYYTMTKLPLEKIRWLPRIVSDFISIMSQIKKGLIKYSNIKSEYLIERTKLDKEFYKQHYNQSKEEFLKSPLSKSYMEHQLKVAAEIDKMWSENAESLGIKYEHGKIHGIT